MQKYAVKSIALEEAIKMIQIAERARQGRLRALFMKQIFLQECRAKEIKLLGQRLADTGMAALQIQKVLTCGHIRIGVGGWGGRQHFPTLWLSSEIQNPKLYL